WMGRIGSLEMGSSTTEVKKRKKMTREGIKGRKQWNKNANWELFATTRIVLMLTDTSVVRATHTQEVLGEQGRRLRELTSLIQKRFRFPETSVSLYAAKVQNRGLSAVAQCESLRYKLLNGLAVRRACYGVLRFIMESGAKGCEVVVSGKLRAARAKSMKFSVCST